MKNNKIIFLVKINFFFLIFKKISIPASLNSSWPSINSSKLSISSDIIRINLLSKLNILYVLYLSINFIKLITFYAF